jgi:hypothetical protein
VFVHTRPTYTPFCIKLNWVHTVSENGIIIPKFDTRHKTPTNVTQNTSFDVVNIAIHGNKPVTSVCDVHSVTLDPYPQEHTWHQQ